MEPVDETTSGAAMDAPAPADEAVRPAELQEFAASDAGSARGSIEVLSDVVLPVTVELGRVSMKIRDLLATGPGSVIELDRLANEPVDILAGGHVIARGEVVVVGQSMGVRVTEFVGGSDKEVDHAESGGP